MNRLYVGREHADAHRRAGRPPPAAAAVARSRRFARALAAELGAAAAAATALDAPARRVGRRGRDGPAARTAGRALVVAGDAAAAGRPRARARDQRRARQRRPDRRLHRAGRGAARSTSSASLRELVARHGAPGTVELLLILGGNPVFTAPADLDFARARCDKVAAARPPRPVRRRDRRRSATGTCPRRTTSRRGATRAPSTARSRSSSR